VRIFGLKFWNVWNASSGKTRSWHGLRSRAERMASPMNGWWILGIAGAGLFVAWALSQKNVAAASSASNSSVLPATPAPGSAGVTFTSCSYTAIDGSVKHGTMQTGGTGEMADLNGICIPPACPDSIEVCWPGQTTQHLIDQNGCSYTNCTGTPTTGSVPALGSISRISASLIHGGAF